MIATFQTPAMGAPAAGASAPAGDGKGSNTLIYLAVAAVAIYLGWTYIIKPEMDKAKAAKAAEDAETE